MREYDPNQTLVSIHVPKCAGSSFIRVLEQWFNAKLSPFSERLERISSQRLQLRRRLRHDANTTIRKKSWLDRWYYPRVHLHYPGWGPIPRYSLRAPNTVIHGHFNPLRGCGVQDYYPDAKQFITILRDPLEVAISNYFYRKREKHEIQRSRKSAWTNLNSHLLNTPSKILNYLPPMTEDTFERILHRDFVYVGIAEDLQTSVDLLAQKLGKRPASVPELNRSQRTENPSTEAVQAFRERTKLEHAVYQFALDHYRQ